jgi:RNA polymerase sigma-B factor
MAAKRKTDLPEPSTRPDAEQKLADERVLWERFAATRDPAIREELVERHLAFAKRLTLRYRAASESFDDQLQVASLGLLKAIDRFDPERGIPFTAFATPTILGELKRHFRDKVWTVRVPRGLHDRMAEVEKALGELTDELQRSPSVQELAERLELEESDILEVLEANHNRRPLSLDRPLSNDDPDEPSSPSEWVGNEDKGFEIAEGRIALGAAIPNLGEREQLVLRLRFVEDMTQTQIAERIGCSQMHVSRILRRTLQQLREQVEGEEGGS